jgi:hypothetical protein
MTQEYTAKQAKHDAQIANNKFLEQEIETIITIIKLAASEGMKGIPISISTHKNTITELQNRGFGVGLNNDDYIVTW